MTITAESLMAERRRATAHLELGMASGAHDVALAAVRSGAAVEQLVPQYIEAAARGGRSEHVEETLARFGLSASDVYRIATGAPLPQGADVAGELAPADRLAVRIRAAGAGGDLGDQIVAIIKQQGGL